MDGWLAAIEQAQLAVYFRNARWGYALLNAGHIGGIALLVGGILPLDLRLLGFWPDIDRRSLTRVLVPTAAFGLVLAIITGTMMFATRAVEYAGLWVFWLKIGFVAAGGLSALLAHLRYGLWLEHAQPRQLIVAAGFSLTCWITALVCGRMIAFVG